MSAVASQPVSAGAHQKMRSNLAGSAKQFKDVALPVTDMYTAIRIAESCRGLPKVLKPAVALFLLDRYPREINLALQLRRVLELFPTPEFDGRQPERQSVCCNRQTRMHQDAALGAWLGTASPFGGGYRIAGVTDEFGVLSFIQERARIVKHKSQRFGHCKALRRCLKMTAQDVLFAYAVIVQKSIGRLGVGPVNTSQGDGFAHTLP